MREGLDAVDVAAACLLAGSMTGAPKRRAAEILDGIEGRARGLYGGAFGYSGSDACVDPAMTIRSIVLDEHLTTIGACGGITALSNSLTKAYGGEPEGHAPTQRTGRRIAAVAMHAEG